MLVYEVKYWDAEQGVSISIEFLTHAEARRYAEERVAVKGNSQAELITWYKHRNLPRCKPDWVYKSTAMSIFRKDGKWYNAAIHDPHYQEWPEEEENVK
jgi:hypothetical protein